MSVIGDVFMFPSVTNQRRSGWKSLLRRARYTAKLINATRLFRFYIACLGDTLRFLPFFFVGDDGNWVVVLSVVGAGISEIRRLIFFSFTWKTIDFRGSSTFQFYHAVCFPEGIFGDALVGAEIRFVDSTNFQHHVFFIAIIHGHRFVLITWKILTMKCHRKWQGDVTAHIKSLWSYRNSFFSHHKIIQVTFRASPL